MKTLSLKSSAFSRPQLALFAVVFALVGYLIFRAFAAPNPSLPGDLNADNTVNITDLSILLSNYGTSNTSADINGDGTVNVLDLSILLSHYGQSYTSTASPDNTVITGTNGQIVDANGHIWTITSGGQVSVDGVADTITSSVTQLAYESGKVWQNNSFGYWWYKMLPTDTWLPTGGTTTSPIPSGSGGTSCSGTGNAKVGSTRGGLMGFANGYRYGQLSSSDRDRYMSVIADEGVKWFRMNMENWSMTEFQDVVTRASARGICVFGDLAANASGTHWADPTDHQAWANSAANMVSQLKSSVHVWEVWNEENTGSFWPGGNFNSYADLLHKTYLAIKAVDPNAIIMPGGPAPCGDGTQACNPINFYKTIYDWNKSQGRQGSSQLFDAAAVHPYGYPWNPTDPANFKDWNAFYQTYLLHQVMLDPSYGGPTNDGAKKIWGTEGGFPSGCPSGITNYDTCITLATAASWISPIMGYWIDTWGSFTGPFMWYEVQNQPNLSTDREGYFGFIDANWNPKQDQYNNLKAYSAQP